MYWSLLSKSHVEVSYWSLLLKILLYTSICNLVLKSPLEVSYWGLLLKSPIEDFEKNYTFMSKIFNMRLQTLHNFVQLNLLKEVAKNSRKFHSSMIVP